MSENDSTGLTSEDFVITPEFTAEEYSKDWSQRLCGLEDFNERDKVFEKFYKFLWDLLFGSEATENTRARAIALLVVERPDASFFNPFIYNDWIKTVREEVIKRDMSDFWQKEIVAKELGLHWARDSDYFDDLDDPRPAAFYKLKDSDPGIGWEKN